MKNLRTSVLLLVLAVSLLTCSKKEPEPNYPAYLRIPSSLTGYTGSGQISITGGLTLLTEGPETLDPATKTYTGVLGTHSDTDIKAYATFGQPLPFKQSSTVPAQYESNGSILIINAISPGTYPVGYGAQTSPTGARIEVILNLPGPQLYTAKLGSLTITESTVVKSEGQDKLYRVQGTFQTSLTGNGTGAKDTYVNGTFDLLLLD